MTPYVLTVNCPSRRGIVAAISGYLAENQCNILDSAQFDDAETGGFFARTTFVSETGVDLQTLIDGFGAVAAPFEMIWAMHDGAQKMKVILMVSRFGHCLNDLLYRWRIGALPIDIVGVVSNHYDYIALTAKPEILGALRP